MGLYVNAALNASPQSSPSSWPSGMVMAADAGYSLKVELSQGGDAANGPVTLLEEWMAKKRNARSS